jgi:hypothetical protein
MPQRLFLTIGSRLRKDRVLLELPGDQPVRDMIPDLVQVVGWKELDTVPKEAFFLETEDGEKLPGGKSLVEAGVSSSDLLYLGFQEAGKAPAEPARDPQEAELKKAVVAADATAVAHVQDILQQPHLMGPHGLLILLSKSPITIGRSGKGIIPDIDLAEWDTKQIISRRHAVIEMTKDGLSLRSEKTTNGTLINGVEVPPGESRLLSDGDRIHFGFKGLELVFRAPD